MTGWKKRLLTVVVYVLMSVLVSSTVTIASMAIADVCGVGPMFLFDVLLVVFVILTKKHRKEKKEEPDGSD